MISWIVKAISSYSTRGITPIASGRSTPTLLLTQLLHAGAPGASVHRSSTMRDMVCCIIHYIDRSLSGFYWRYWTGMDVPAQLQGWWIHPLRPLPTRPNSAVLIYWSVRLQYSLPQTRYQTLIRTRSVFNLFFRLISCTYHKYKHRFAMSTLDILALYTNINHEEVLDIVRNIDSPSNGISMQADWHDAFDEFIVCLVPITNVRLSFFLRIYVDKS